MKRTGPTNIYLRLTAAYLRKQSRIHGAKIWRYIADLLLKPTRSRVEVNVSKINRFTGEGDIVVVPGKVLGTGNISHKVIVAAWSFSEKAKEKIESAGGKCLAIPELVEKYPNGSNIKIIV